MSKVGSRLMEYRITLELMIGEDNIDELESILLLGMYYVGHPYTFFM